MEQAKIAQEQSPQVDPMLRQWASYGRFVAWSAERTRMELEELDKYAQEKIRDLVRKFHTIAESANVHVKNAETNKGMATILVGNRMMSYAEAIVELDKLSTALSKGGIMTDQ